MTRKRRGTNLPLPDGMPTDLPIVEREVVRVVVRDRCDRILLFHTREASAPELGEWWELPGGGIDSEETVTEAACREVREEAGINLSTSQVGPPTWRRTGVFRHRQVRHLSHEVIVQARLDVTGPPIDASGRTDYEKEDYFDFRWWPITELIGSTGKFYPQRFPRLLQAFLDGEEIDEPIEYWS